MSELAIPLHLTTFRCRIAHGWSPAARVHVLQAIGAHGRPLAGYLGVTEAMASDGRHTVRSVLPQIDSTQIVRLVGDTIAASAHQQAESLRAAQRNHYLWRRGAAPLDVVNLEDVAITGLLMRSDFMLGRSGYDLLSDRLSDDDPLASVPLWAAEQMPQALRHSRARETVLDLIADGRGIHESEDQ